MKTLKNRREKDLETLVVLSAALLLFYVFTRRDVLLFTALVLLLAAAFIKGLSSRIAGAWLSFSEVLGGVNSKLLLGAVYFLCLTPIALLFRLFNKDPLDMAVVRNGGTAFRVREHSYTAVDFEKTW